MTTLKVGERVSVYDIQSGCAGAYGTVKKVRIAPDDLKIDLFAHDIITVTIDAWKKDLTTTLNVFPEQCRRLKPKEKKKPREIWVGEEDDGDLGLYNYDDKKTCDVMSHCKRAVKFVECFDD